MPLPARRRVRRGEDACSSELEGMAPAAQGPEAQLDPDRAEPGADGDQRVAAALHLPEPLRLPRGRGDREPRAAGGGAVGVLRPLVRASRPATWRRRASPSSRCPSSRRGCSTARWSAWTLLDEFGPRGLRRPRSGRRALRGTADRGEEGGRAATRSTSACPSRRRTASRSGRKGDELVVSVDNQRRHILLPRSLASRRLLGAAFKEQRLRVAFGEKEDAMAE